MTGLLQTVDYLLCTLLPGSSHKHVSSTSAKQCCVQFVGTWFAETVAETFDIPPSATSAFHPAQQRSEEALGGSGLICCNLCQSRGLAIPAGSFKGKFARCCWQQPQAHWQHSSTAIAAVATQHSGGKCLICYGLRLSLLHTTANSSHERFSSTTAQPRSIQGAGA